MGSIPDAWSKELTGKKVGKYVLGSFVGSGKIGYVYQGHREDFPSGICAVKLTFDTLKPGWQVELEKVMKLALVEGVVHFRDLGEGSVTHNNETHLCQFTVWDYVPPGQNLKQYLQRAGSISTSFLLAVVERILRVLHACETEGVIRHGDLHSGNILIGKQSNAQLDDSLQPRAAVYVSDFGYGATSGVRTPKDDFRGLLQIINEIIPRIEYGKATATHRKLLQVLRTDFGKFLNEGTGAERRKPLELLGALGARPRFSI